MEINSVLLESAAADGLLHPSLREARTIGECCGFFFVGQSFCFNARFISAIVGGVGSAAAAAAAGGLMRKRHLLGVPRSSMTSTKRTVMNFLTRAKNAQALHTPRIGSIGQTIGM